jgi:hypothetical protein
MHYLRFGVGRNGRVHPARRYKGGRARLRPDPMHGRGSVRPNPIHFPRYGTGRSGRVHPARRYKSGAARVTPNPIHGIARFAPNPIHSQGKPQAT